MSLALQCLHRMTSRPLVCAGGGLVLLLRAAVVRAPALAWWPRLRVSIGVTTAQTFSSI